MNQTRPDYEGGYYSENSAASVAGLGLRKLRELADAGEIATKRVDGVRLFAKQDIRRLRDSRERTAEEAQLDLAFNGWAESRAEQQSMARENGHEISRENAPRNPGETATSRMICTCGWTSPWLVNSQATQLKREHLKESAIQL